MKRTHLSTRIHDGVDQRPGECGAAPLGDESVVIDVVHMWSKRDLAVHRRRMALECEKQPFLTVGRQLRLQRHE